jgi:hypothetical protein
MHHDVEPRAPGVRQHRENQLSGIENCGRGVSQQRHPGVLLWFPERPPALAPFLLNTLMQRVIEMARVTKPELLALKKSWGITAQEQRRETNQGQDH